MNGKDLFEGISHIDERYIEEAETKAFPRKYWTNAAALAACLCIILFSLYSLWNPIATEGNIAQDESTHPAGGIGPMDGEAIPEDSPITEVPSVILYVEEPTEYGWIGTVCELVDTDIFEVGMELNVVMTETIWQEDGDGNSLVVEQKRPDYSGCYVMVQFIHYDPETNTIAVNLIREVQPAETTP